MKTLESTPRGATHWSTRSMAKAVGLNAMAISRIWRAFGLQPHRAETFTLSPDPLLIDKVRDIIGLSMAPPEHALVLCVDEKAQIQALDRTAPLWRLRPGQAERGTPDYRRHGTTTLFAALNVKTGKVLGETRARHRAVEFRKFLDRIDANVPADLDVHLPGRSANVAFARAHVAAHPRGNPRRHRRLSVDHRMLAQKDDLGVTKAHMALATGRGCPLVRGAGVRDRHRPPYLSTAAVQRVVHSNGCRNKTGAGAIKRPVLMVLGSLRFFSRPYLARSTCPTLCEQARGQQTNA